MEEKEQNEKANSTAKWTKRKHKRIVIPKGSNCGYATAFIENSVEIAITLVDISRGGICAKVMNKGNKVEIQLETSKMINCVILTDSIEGNTDNAKILADYEIRWIKSENGQYFIGAQLISFATPKSEIMLDRKIHFFEEADESK